MTNTRRVRYFIVGDRPIKQIHDPSVPSLTAAKYDWETGRFVPGDEYLAEVMLSTGDVEEIDEDAFIQHVERLRRRDIPPQGALVALYDLLNATEEVAQAAGRKLTAEERALIVSLQRQTFQIFERATDQGVQPQRRIASVPADQSKATPATPATPQRPATPIRPTRADSEAPAIVIAQAPTAVKAALDRLLAIPWRPEPAHDVSNVALLREYFRRATHWGRALNAVEQWPFFDVAARIDPTARVVPALVDLLEAQLKAQQVTERFRQTCVWFLHWSLIAEQPEVQRFGLLPPYDPLILMYERGGTFRSEHGFYYVGSAGMPRGLPKDYMSTEPIVALEPRLLDALDTSTAQRRK